MIIDFTTVTELKKFVSEKTGVYVHFHDACGGQYFNFDEPSQNGKIAVIEFFKQKGLEVNFDKDDKSFTVK